MENKNTTKHNSTNVYIKNILLIIFVCALLVAITLFALKIYTKHNESVTIPPIKGLQIEEAAKILKNSDLKYEVVDSIYLEKGVPGAIQDQIPREKSNVKKGRTVFLIIQAKTPQLMIMPELRDYSLRQAEAQLNALGFNKITIETAPSRYQGLVVSLEYNGQPVKEGQKIPKGSALKIIVGSGNEDELPQDSITENVNDTIKNLFLE